MNDSHMKHIGVYGLGYVGGVSAAALASRGHRVIGVDVNREKVELLRQGRSPSSRSDRRPHRRGRRLGHARRSPPMYPRTVTSTDISLVCVGTPSSPRRRVVDDSPSSR